MVRSWRHLLQPSEGQNENEESIRRRMTTRVVIHGDGEGDWSSLGRVILENNLLKKEKQHWREERRELVEGDRDLCLDHDGEYPDPDLLLL